MLSRKNPDLCGRQERAWAKQQVEEPEEVMLMLNTQVMSALVPFLYLPSPQLWGISDCSAPSSRKANEWLAMALALQNGSGKLWWKLERESTAADGAELLR